MSEQERKDHHSIIRGCCKSIEAIIGDMQDSRLRLLHKPLKNYEKNTPNKDNKPHTDA